MTTEKTPPNYIYTGNEDSTMTDVTPTPPTEEPQQDETVQQDTNWLTREPIALMYVIQTGIALAIGFGVAITPDQLALILTFTGAVLTFVTRERVTPFVPVGTTPTLNDTTQTPTKRV